MATVHHELEFRSSPEEVWAKVADVGAVNRIMPFLGEVTLEGDRRTCAIGEATLEELIVTIDPDRRRLAYAIVGGPLPFTQLVSARLGMRQGGKYPWELVTTTAGNRG